MLSSVLRGERAALVNVEIMRAFSPPPRAGDRAQARAQAKPSTERARAEHEVGVVGARAGAARAEDGDRLSTA